MAETDTKITRDSPIGLAKLSKMSFDGVDMRPLWQELCAKVEKKVEGEAPALMDMSLIAQLSGSYELAKDLQKLALKISRVYTFPSRTQPPKLRLLALASEGEISSNTPIEYLLEDSDIELIKLYIDPEVPIPDPLPQHDITMVIASELDLAPQIFLEITKLVKKWPSFVIDKPKNIAKLHRDQLYKVAQSIPGIYIPATHRTSRVSLKKGNLDEHYPFIIRPLDSYAGKGLERIEDKTALKAYLEIRLDEEFYTSPYVDYASPDGCFRKYRIAVIDGKSFGCHLAIADQWALWYMNAQMMESAEKRAEEAQFMAEYDTTGFGARHGKAISALAEQLQLEYFILDCAETKTGELLIFEAGHDMAVHNMDPVSLFPYKEPQMKKVFAAFISMLCKYAGS